MAYSKDKLAARMKIGTETDRRDFFYHLLKAKDPETGLGFATQELWGESNVLLIAGSDTTSTVLSSTLFYLLHKPQFLAHLTHLIRSTFSTPESIVPSNLSSAGSSTAASIGTIRYLRACIDESMRLSPPVPGLLPREVQSGGMEIDGRWFPEGTVVGVPIYALHHNERYYTDASAYKPERWLNETDMLHGDAEKSDDMKGEEEKHSIARAQSAFTPFSIGPRGCIGKGIAYLELSVALARVLWLYDLRLAPGYEEEGVDRSKDQRDGFGNGVSGRQQNQEYGLRDCFVAEKQGPWVQFKGR